jgi:hypothetical protein
MAFMLASMLIVMSAFEVIRPNLFANVYPNWLEVLAAAGVGGIAAFIGIQVSKLFDGNARNKKAEGDGH